MDCGIIVPSVNPNSNIFSVHASPRSSPCIMVRCQQKEGQVKNTHHYNELPLLKRKRPTMINIPVDRSLENNIIINTSRVRVQEVEVEEDGYGVYSKKGISRSRLEDRHSANFVNDGQGNSKQALFGIFDGHGGAKAAEFAASKLGNIILDHLKRGDKSMIEENIKKGYLAADEEFLKGNTSGGVCCVTALIQHNTLIVSNVGDCRAVISRSGVAESLTNDHNPSREDEKLRIQSKGGYVDCCNGVWRIQGSLAVSRAIGDQHLKQWVTAEPDTKILTIKPDFQFLILASDGLWNKSTTIQASIGYYNYETFGSRIEEGKSYSLSNFKIYKNKSDYKVSEHEYKIYFAKYTSLKVCHDLVAPPYEIKFMHFNKILADECDPSFLIDIIGEVVEYSIVEVASKQTINLELYDTEDNHLSCKLWDSYAEQVLEYISKHNTNSTFTIVLRFAKIKKWPRSITIANSMYTSRLIINGDIPEVHAFKQRMKKIRGEGSTTLIEVEAQGTKSDEEIFLNSYDVLPLSGYAKLMKGGTFVTCATIVAIDPNHPWSYNSCNKCLQKVIDGDELMLCPTCKSEFQIAYPRYKVFVTVDDSDSTGTFVLFDSIVKKELVISANEIRERQEKSGDLESFPVELNYFVGKTYLFIVKVSEDYNIKKGIKSYTVCKMTDDAYLVTKFCDKAREVVSNVAYNSSITPVKRNIELITKDEDQNMESSSKRR